MSYSFEIEFLRYNRTSPALEDIRAIYIGKICIIAKNHKCGEPYVSKYVTSINGKFSICAGSHSYPCLYPAIDTTIFVDNFPFMPDLEFDEMDIKYKSHFLKLKNIIKHEHKKPSNRIA